MKMTVLLKGTGWILNHGIKKQGIDPALIYQEYKDIIQRADDIGKHNILLGAYGLAAYFIAMHRQSGFNDDENFKIIEKALKNSKLYAILMGDADSYFSEKAMERRRKWSQETYKRKYKNDWVVDFIEKSDTYEFGFDYHECGVCKLCQNENCMDIAKYLCKLDYMTVDMMGIGLDRTKTLANGDDVCDFRFKRLK